MTHTILLVEDNDDDAVLVMRAFHKSYRTVTVQCVSDGEGAQEYLAGLAGFADRLRYPFPALVLLDLKLPRISGLEVLSWVRQQPGVRRIPVVILTSSRESVDLKRAYDLGANSYLVKPVSPDAMQHLAGTLGLYWLKLNEAAPLT